MIVIIMTVTVMMMIMMMMMMKGVGIRLTFVPLLSQEEEGRCRREQREQIVGIDDVLFLHDSIHGFDESHVDLRDVSIVRLWHVLQKGFSGTTDAMSEGVEGVQRLS